MMIQDLITYTKWSTNHLKLNKNTNNMAKYPPKHLNIRSNQRTIIQRHVKVKRPKKLQHQSSQNTEAKKVNAIIEQLDELDRKLHRRKTNIKYFVPLFEPDMRRALSTLLNPRLQ